MQSCTQKFSPVRCKMALPSDHSLTSGAASRVEGSESPQVGTTGHCGMAETGVGEMETSTKELPPSTPSHSPYQEWAAVFQAYYASGALPPPGFFPPSVGSPHPYMWGAQPLMPPYGTPSSYATVYPHGGVCTHPSMAPVAHPYGPYNMLLGNACDTQGVVASTGTDAEGKANNGKSKCRRRKCKAGFEKIAKESDPHKGNSGCTDGGLSHSGDSGSEGSTQGSEEGSQNGSQVICKSNVDQVPPSIGGKQVVGGGPLTSLNIGMDYCSGGTPNLLASGKRGPSATAALISPSNLHDRELKRERRKQSNRESARRSRMRKQAEYDELAARVELLSRENETLRNELSRISEEYKKLVEENASLMDQLQIPRSDALHRELEQNSKLLDKEGLHLDSGNLQGETADNANQGGGSTNVDYGVGNLVLSSS